MVEIIEIENEGKLEPASYTTAAYFVVNFAFKNAVKIVPYYRCFSKNRLALLSSRFKDVGINLRQDDILSMLHFLLLNLTLVKPEVDTYFVGNAGLTETSLDFLKSNISKMAPFHGKKIYVCCLT